MIDSELPIKPSRVKGWRAVRGSWFSSAASMCVSWWRSKHHKNVRYKTVGFRVLKFR